MSAIYFMDTSRGVFMLCDHETAVSIRFQLRHEQVNADSAGIYVLGVDAIPVPVGGEQTGMEVPEMVSKEDALERIRQHRR